MARAKNHGLIIAGDGVSAALAVLAMAQRRPDLPLLLVGEAERFGGDRSLFVLDGQLSGEERLFLDPLTAARWDGFYVSFPGRSRKLKLACRLVSPGLIDAAMRRDVPAERLRTGRKVVAVRDTSLLLDGGDSLAGDGALDARAWAQQTTLDLGWRHVVARTYEFAAPHRVDLPVLVDSAASRGAAEGAACAHFSLMPLSPTRLLVEHVRYAGSPEPAGASAAAEIDPYLRLRGWSGGDIVEETEASLPIALGGDFDAYYRIGGARVAKIGPRGGFFFPTLGSPLPDAARTALLLAHQRDLSGPALHDTFEQEAPALWKRREPQRGFDRRLLAGQGCTALESLFGLEPALVDRYFGERLGLFDRRKLAAL
jgi:lycopene beta-cyclase